MSNISTQDEFDYLQKGRYDNAGVYVPILEDLSAFADGTPLSSGLVNDGTRFLNTGEKLRFPKSPEMIQNLPELYDVSEDPIDISFTDLSTLNLTNNQYFIDLSNTDYAENFRFHKNNLTTRQINTEKKLTNN